MLTGPRIVVTGGRDFGQWPPKRLLGTFEFVRLIKQAEADRAKIANILREQAPSEIAQGGALGADNLAWRWARANSVPCKTYEANWAVDGKAAGPIRNAWMLRDFGPDLVIAFRGNRGTADCVAKARSLSIAVLEVR